MKQLVFKIGILIWFIYGANSVYAQSLENDVRRIVDKTVDMRYINGVKELSSMIEDKDIKKSCLDDFEKSLEGFYKVYIDFYSSKYTHEEIKQMLAFYETPTGKKFANDLLLLSSNSFPKGNEWGKKLEDIKKKLKK